MTNGKLRFVERQETDVWQRKKDLRSYMKRRRSDNENRDVKETLLIDNVVRLLECDLSKTNGAGTRLNVMVYLSFSSEARTDKLIETLREKGATLYAPRVEGKEITAVAIGEDYTLSALGIREPVGEKYDGEIDVVITPLLAVDTQGNRLGYGGGYYDKFFDKYPNARRVGYCYDFQVLKNVPHTDSDKRLQYIITDKRTIVCTDKT
jgi:5-formyltetrahydrofolate cyclo-ligase